MNKNRYKLIFSKTTSCLIPVAEFINSVTENSSENSDGDNSYKTYRLSFLSQSLQKGFISIWGVSTLLFTLPSIAFANEIEVDEKYKDKTSVSFTDNKVAIIDIAKPESDGVSDNRFNKFNVNNGAVFKNNKQADNSTLVGYLDKSKNSGNSAAKTILTQVTGKETTTLKGGLEVLGERADLLVVNPNGITVNGVKTFNSDRFIVSTSDVIDPKKGKLNLSVDKGTVTIGENGLSTDGLRSVEVIAKKIEQKGAIKHNTTETINPANITLVAGSSEYDLATRQAKSKGVTTNDVILSGTEAGAMYGDYVNFIVTDTGAGVNHKGIILAEADIVLENKNGNVSVSTLQAKNQINVSNVTNFEVNDKVEARNITVSAKKTSLKNKSKVKSQNSLDISGDASLGQDAKISAKHIKIKSDKLNADVNATIIAHNATLETSILDNKGTISARNVEAVNKKYLHNEGNILAENNINLTVVGSETEYKKDITNGFFNFGNVQSQNNAQLIFSNNTNFSALAVHNAPQAKNTLTIKSNKFTIEKGQEVQAANDLVVHSNNFSNSGLLGAANHLQVFNLERATNDGLIGAGKRYEFNSMDIYNNASGTFHSEGTSFLNATYTLINSGKILSRDKLTISASSLINDISLESNVSENDLKVDNTQTVNRNALRYDVYKLEGKVKELGASFKTKSVGHIRAENGLEFIQQHNVDQNLQGIDNHGIINVKGEFFNNGTTRINNSINPLIKNIKKDFWDKENADLYLKFKPFTRFWLAITPLAGEATKNFKSISALLDHFFLGNNEVISSSLYSGYATTYTKNLKNLQSPQLQQMLTQIFGQNWENKDFAFLSEKWKKVRDIGFSIHFHPDAQAKILASYFRGDISVLKNGKNALTSTFDENLHFENSNFELPKISLKDVITHNNTDNPEIDLSILADLLNDTNLFIDRSLQMIRPEPKPPVLSGEDKELLSETEEETAEKLRKAKEEAERIAKEQQRLKEQKEKAERERQQKIAEERRRKAQEALAEQQRKEREALEIEQARRKAEKERLEKLEEEHKALAEKQRQERLALEMKLKREQEEIEEQRRKERLAKEKAEEQLRLAEEKRLKEYREKLAEEKRKAEELANTRSLLQNDNRPRVEVDPQYHTRAKYIKQDEYVGADYFFNNVVPEVKGQTKVKVIGDNYFEHQLITRTIEKKVDNHLSLKYDLNDRDLVKHLMDNAANKSKELNLTVGTALTKEQQDSLKEDIIWYVKSEVKGQEVFIPQVYFASETLADAKKYQGLGQAVIKAKEIELKTQQFNNDASVIADNINIQSQGKITNAGAIISRNQTKLKAKEGIELTSKTVADEKGNTVTEKAKILSEGHIHLETDLNNNIDISAAEIKGKTGFIKSKDLNVKDTYEVTSERQSSEIYSGLSGLSIGNRESNKLNVKSVGSNVEFDHLHLALKGDLNQQGSRIDTERTTGVVQGNVNTKAGKNFTHQDKSENVTALELFYRMSALGHESTLSYDEVKGSSSASGRSNQAGSNFEGGLAIRNTEESEAHLKHNNSVLNAKSGELHVLGNADIGGVDINSDNAVTSEKAQKEAAKENQDSLELTNSSLAEARKQQQKDLQGLSETQLAELMKEKDAQFYEAEKQRKNEGFSLSASSISSTKEQDRYQHNKTGFNIKLGLEAEAHSAIADAATGIAKQVLEAKEGLKQDGTAVLQHTSEAINLVTGDLIGGSVKLKAEFGNDRTSIKQTQDVRTHIGGKTALIARDGDLTLNNVQSNSDSELTLTAKENVNLNAGQSTNKQDSFSATTKVFAGESVSCGVMSKGCAAGFTSGIEARANIGSVDNIERQNSLLQGKQITINAGKNLNLVGANVNASQVNLDVKGDTNIISLQGKIDRTEHSADSSVSGGVSINTALELKPTGSVSAGYGYEYEKGNKVNQQSGINADRIVGELNNVNLKAGHIVDKSQGKDIRIKGDVTHANIKDSHHKDGGNFGVTVGLNERGTAQFNIRGGRVEQLHYEATQQSTLQGAKVDKEKVSGGELNTDFNKSKIIHQNDRIGSSRFEFEVLDIAELGQKARDKVRSNKPRNNSAETISPRSAKNEPVYEEIASSPYGKLGDANADFRRNNAVDSDSIANRAKSEPIYEEIAPSPYGKLGDANADFRRNNAVDSDNIANRAKSEPIYDEVAPSPYGKLGDTNADFRRAGSAEKAGSPIESIYSEISAPAPKNGNDVYAQVDKSAQAKAKAEQRSAEATTTQNKTKVEEIAPQLPPRPQLDIAENSKNSAKTDRLQNNKASQSGSGSDYAEVAEVQPQSNSRAKRALPDLPTDKAKPEIASEGDYAEIPALTPRAKQSAGESDYATIPELGLKPQAESAEVSQPKAKAVVEEGLYAQVNKTPEAKALAEQRSRAAEQASSQAKQAAVDAEDTPPTLPPRPQSNAAEVNTNNNNAKVIAKPSVETVEVEALPKKSLKVESESLFDKVKNWFKGSSSATAKKAPKSAVKAEENAAPNYDNLPDSANLKGLLNLENQRNAEFDSKVLKNPDFLAEAKEAAKKYIPEATIKQMGDSPEFNDILTEGARKIEQRINDTITFKPTVEEFNNIQNLVKQLPKGSVLKETSAVTDSVTEALASTSKTIQKNPELKEQIRGAIDEFLTASKGQDLTVEMIEKLNHGLRPDEGADRLLYKKETLTKENAVFSSPESSKIQLKETVDFINNARNSGVESSVLAGLVYQRLIAYHPFAEGNGRMARVIVNKILLDAGYPPFTKFNESFETQIIPQTNNEATSASSSKVVTEFLKELTQKQLPEGSQPLPKTDLQKIDENRPLVEPQAVEAEVPVKKATPIDDKVQSQTLVEQSRSTAQKIKDQFQPLRVGKKIKDVRESVEKYGGEVSFKFAQSKGEVFNEIIKHTETQHGACEATCAFWIAKKVNDDQSLFKEIYPNGKAGKLDKQAFEKIKKLQTDFINSGNSATQQFKFTESWLTEQGVKVKQKQVGDFSRKDEVAGTVTNTDVKALTQAILGTGNDNSGVKKISINLKGGSHTVAASVKGEKVVFFDPNFGEVSFNSHSQFEKWFKEAFWSKSGYAGSDSSKRFFNVINYHAE